MSPFERAARTLCELEGNPPGATFEKRPMWKSYLPQVEAVVAALREPSDPMITAAISKGQEIGYTDVIGVWRAMIDAAGE